MRVGCVALPAAPETLCDCCRFNETIPDLSVPGNLQKWYRLEAAKRRLFYMLGELGLPYGTAADGVQPPLRFNFKADVISASDFWRSAGPEQKIYTGHSAGRITINIRESDDVEREKLRVDLGEAQRTLIGHFRHEIGHYYWDVLIKGRREAESIAVFGDHNNPSYEDALDRHYNQGPPADWAERHVSAYASMHPWEDFAETWALYLDMVSVLDTAAHNDLPVACVMPQEAVAAPVSNPDAVLAAAARPAAGKPPIAKEFEGMVRQYQELGIKLNEVNRSMGLIDLVPEVIVPPVIDKLRFIHELVKVGRAENGAIGGKPAKLAAAG